MLENPAVKATIYSCSFFTFVVAATLIFLLLGEGMCEDPAPLESFSQEDYEGLWY